MAHLLTDTAREAVAGAERAGRIVTRRIDDVCFYRQLAELNAEKRRRRLGTAKQIGRKKRPPKN